MPHRSGFLGIFYTILILVLLKYLAFYAPVTADSLVLIAKTVLAAAAIGAMVFLCAAALNRWRSWSLERYWPFALELAVLSLLVTAARSVLAVTQFPSSHLSELSQPYLQTFMLNFGTLLVINAALNLTQRDISDQLAAAQNLTASLRARQQALVVSDEEIKQQVAQFLHNRIQSDLMVSGLRLKEIAADLPFTEGSKLLDVVAKLEKVRSMDIRSLSQSLGPSLTSQKLRDSFDALARIYDGQMVVQVTMDATAEKLISEVSDQLQLGLYRITEQALLNSLVHGPAANVSIGLSAPKAGFLSLVIKDDGPGAVAGQASAGLGTSIIDAWVDILGGWKTIRTALDAGYELQVLVPVAAKS